MTDKSDPKERKKILIVDDEKDFVHLLKIELEGEDFDVICAYDGMEGFSKYIERRPDLIVLDLMLPKLNGHEVCRKIRREQKDTETPIIMFTALKEDTERIIGRVIGADKYLTKPAATGELLSEIRALLHLY